MNKSERLMGIDFGEKRVGIASTDEMGGFSLPRVVLVNDEKLLDEIERLADDWATEKIIIGESLDFKGKPNKIHESAEKFAQALKKRGRKIEFHPELLTSLEAERIQGKNEMLDASAAALILKSYIDSQKHDQHG
jgi:putative holliday junction resolvase